MYLFIVTLLRDLGQVALHARRPQAAVAPTRARAGRGRRSRAAAWESGLRPPPPRTRKSLILGVHTARPAQKPIGKGGGGASPPGFFGGFWGREGPFGPQTSTISGSGKRVFN